MEHSNATTASLQSETSLKRFRIQGYRFEKAAHNCFFKCLHMIVSNWLFKIITQSLNNVLCSYYISKIRGIHFLTYKKDPIQEFTKQTSLYALLAGVLYSVNNKQYITMTSMDTYRYAMTYREFQSLNDGHKVQGDSLEKACLEKFHKLATQHTSLPLIKAGTDFWCLFILYATLGKSYNSTFGKYRDAIYADSVWLLEFHKILSVLQKSPML